MITGPRGRWVAVAVWLLLDTFLVPALPIPAITYRLGDRAWWPQSLAHFENSERKTPKE